MKLGRQAATLAGILGIALTQAPALAESTPGVMSRSLIKGDPVSVCGNRAYVANSYSETISVIDLASNTLVKQLPTGNSPVNPTFNADWTRLYFSNVMSGTLGVVDTASAEVIDTIPAGGDHPSGLRFLPDGRHLIVSYIGDNVKDPGALGKMDLETGEMVWKVPVQAQSERFDITPDGKRAYVANLIGQSVSVVDLEQGKVIATIPAPDPYPFNVLVSPRGDRAFVAAAMGKTIIEIDTATNSVVKTIETAEGPNGMTFTPDGYNILFTAVYAGRLQAYNLSSGVLNQGNPVGLLPGHIRLAPDGLKGVFVRPYGRQATIFDGTTMEVIENIETGIGPSTVAICGNP